MTASIEKRAIVLRYHEIALKGDNRAWFEERLAINARKLLTRALGASAAIDVDDSLHGRIVIRTEWNEKTRTTLSKLFGITSFSPMRILPTDLEAIREGAKEELAAHIRKHGTPRSFRVQTRRSDKAVPQTSIEIDRFIGTGLHEVFPDLVLDLKNPELTLAIEVRFKESFISLEKIAGPGGLPVGTNGLLLSLISGGLDSPVAAIRALRRGASVSFIHFYGAPFVGEEVLQKVEDLVRSVNGFQADPGPLYVVPFGKIQERMALATNPKMRTVLYRRMMVRISCELASKIKAKALLTGESLGQVASQTLENLSTIDTVATLPILRPLITYDKDEIIQEAKRRGTYETSIRPGDDCCTLFADRHPSIRTSLSQIEEQESKLPIGELVQEALQSVETRWPSRA